MVLRVEPSHALCDLDSNLPGDARPRPADLLLHPGPFCASNQRHNLHEDRPYRHSDFSLILQAAVLVVEIRNQSRIEGVLMTSQRYSID